MFRPNFVVRLWNVGQYLFSQSSDNVSEENKDASNRYIKKGVEIDNYTGWVVGYFSNPRIDQANER